MRVEIAVNPKKTRKITFQEDFPEETRCCRCGGKALLAFVAHEQAVQGEYEYVSKLWVNDPPDFLWLHDLCAVAVYFCIRCLEPTALANQG